MTPSLVPDPADTDAWNAYLAEGNAKQARKRVAADVLLRDPSGRVLLVNRELMEELGIRVTLLGLLVVDWVAPHGPWDDQLA